MRGVDRHLNVHLSLFQVPTTAHTSPMGPPRRARSNSSVSASTRSRQPSVNAHPDPTQQTHPNIGMSPASRYNANMKVVRRRDPSIVSIFDQFSHVCVYHHNGDKWEKHGFEGSMFLYER